MSQSVLYFHLLNLTTLHFAFHDISVFHVSGFYWVEPLRPIPSRACAFAPLLPSTGHSWSLAPGGKGLRAWVKNVEGIWMKHCAELDNYSMPARSAQTRRLERFIQKVYWIGSEKSQKKKVLA